MKKILYGLIAFLWAIQLSAQAPSGYYSRADGKKKEALKSAMRDIIYKANVLDYGSGSGHTWEGFYSTDRYDGNKVRDRYSNDIFYFSNKGAAPSGMNIEHSFPKSWWGGTTNQAYKDLFNLMPSEQKINSSKSNYAMGKVTNATTDNGCTKVGKGPAGGKTANLWEPADKWKGDFARSYFYMVTCYSNLTWSGTEALTMLENNNWPTLQKWAYELFVQWNKQDPVDDIERERNEAVYKIQGNRNPFVDYPNLCEYIWGDSIDYAFSVDGSTTGGGGKPDVNPEELIAYEATEILCSIYSKRFDANWSKYKDGCTYTLDVYTKEGTKETSLEGFPVETTATSYRVTGVKANTTYYYTVYVYENGEMVASSNEIRVDMPDVSPVFTASESRLQFSAVPGVPSEKQEVKVTMMAVKHTEAKVVSTYPFEVSLDGESWSLGTIVSGSGSSFYVRMSAQDDEGSYDGKLTLTCEGASDIEIPLSAQVHAQMAFLETFEKGSKGSYAVGNVQCAAAEWKFNDALIGKDVHANDVYAARIKCNGYIEMLEDKLMGCDSLWLYAAPYGSDANMSMTIDYSTDGGMTWKNVCTKMTVGDWQRYGFKIDCQEPIRLRVTAAGTSSKRINVDDIQMSDFDMATHIADYMAREARAAEIYDISGRRLQHMGSRGVYVVGGKKVVR